MVDIINEYTRETTCEYKGEVYSVRDNGAVMRHVREGKKARKLDNIWTFGKKDPKKGYMMFSSHRVHIIVARAFIPGNEDGKMVVDHIDTNRCNNRVENLRWLTKLENVLLNEATLKRVTYLCGGDIQKFIDNPSCMRDLTGDNQDIMWMRTVTAEEARTAWDHISAWSKRPSSTYKMMQKQEKIKDFEQWLEVHKVKEEHHTKDGNTIINLDSTKHSRSGIMGEDVEQYHGHIGTSSNPELNEEYVETLNAWKEQEAFANTKNESFTKGALQIHFHEKLYFPLCPEVSAVVNLDEYAKRLEMGKVFAYGVGGNNYIIKSIGWSFNWDFLQIETEVKTDKWQIPCFIHISIEEGKYVHSSGEFEANYRFCDSPNVLQCGAITQCYFPLCPKEGNISLEEYAALLQKNALCEKNLYTDGYVFDREITKSKDGTSIIYVGVEMPESLKPYGDMIIFVEHGKVIHQIGSTYFDKRYLEREFCRIRGQEWNDEEEIDDDYC